MSKHLPHHQRVLAGVNTAKPGEPDTRLEAKVVGYQDYEPPLSYLVVFDDGAVTWLPSDQVEAIDGLAAAEAGAGGDASARSETLTLRNPAEGDAAAAAAEGAEKVA